MMKSVYASFFVYATTQGVNDNNDSNNNSNASPNTEEGALGLGVSAIQLTGSASINSAFFQPRFGAKAKKTVSEVPEFEGPEVVFIGETTPETTDSETTTDAEESKLDWMTKLAKKYQAPMGTILENNARRHLVVASDIDDTLFCAGPSMKGKIAGMDKSCQHGAVYPGAKTFLTRLLGANSLYTSSEFVVTTARPALLDGGKTLKKFKSFETVYENYLRPDQAGILNGSLKTGAQHAVENVFCKACCGWFFRTSAYTQMGDKKARDLEDYVADNDTDVIFMGDNGQGDLLACVKMIQADRLNVKACFIHDIRSVMAVLEGEGPATTNSGSYNGRQVIASLPKVQDQAEGMAEFRALPATLQKKVIFFDTYATLAEQVAAHDAFLGEEIGLFSEQDRDAVLEDFAKEFDAVHLSELKYGRRMAEEVFGPAEF